MPLLLKLERAYNEVKDDPAFHAELNGLLKHYVGRPNPLYLAERLTKHLGGAKIYFKREDLNHTGAHKINNCLGQILLAKRMGKTRIIAETGAGQHGVATATVAALFGLPCVIYMGEVDIERQKPNVFRMNLLGAEVRPVGSGSRTLKDAMNEALRDWVANVHDTFYIIGSAAGPHPYPVMVRDFQTVIGKETRAQLMEREGRLPDLLIACVGGGSNAIGLFHPFLDESSVDDSRRRSGGRGARDRASCGDAFEGHARRSAWRALLSAAGRGRAGARGALDFRRPRLSRRRSRALLAQGFGPRHLCRRRPTPKRWTRFSSPAGSKASSPRWNPRMPSRTRCASRRSWRRTRSSSSASPAAATRTCSPSPARSVRSCDVGNADRRTLCRVARRQSARASFRSSPRAIPIARPRSRSSSSCRKRAPTSSSSACRSPIRWRTVRRSRRLRCAR